MEILDVLRAEGLAVFKIFAIIVAFVHLLSGFILFFQVLSIKKILKLQNSNFFVVVGYIYILVLIAVLILIILY